MPTVVLDPAPHEIEALRERRRRSGLDRLDEVLIVDPQERAVHWLANTDGEYRPIERSGLIALGATELAARLNWP
jgi:hypothetical protein